MIRALLVSTAALWCVLAVFGATAAFAVDIPCTGPMGATTLTGNVYAGPGCDLTDTTVIGNVIVKPGGTLGIYPSPSPTATTPTTGTGTTKSKALISGTVWSVRASRIEIRAGWIRGDVKIGSTTDDGANGLLVENATIDGDVVLRRGTAFLFLQYVDVGGDVAVYGNKGTDPSGLYGYVIGLFRSAVAGHVILFNNDASGSFMNAVGVGESTIGKDLLMQENVARNGTDQNLVLARANVVGGNLWMNQNRAIPVPGNPASQFNSFIEVSQNNIALVLGCRDNVPDPVLNGTAPSQFNIAAKKRGECAGL